MEKSENDMGNCAKHSHVKGKKNVDHIHYFLILQLKLKSHNERCRNLKRWKPQRKEAFFLFSYFLLIPSHSLTFCFCKVCITILHFSWISPPFSLLQASLFHFWLHATGTWLRWLIHHPRSKELWWYLIFTIPTLVVSRTTFITSLNACSS